MNPSSDLEPQPKESKANPDVHPLIPPETPYLHAATSDNTRRAYQSDIQQFLAAGAVLPATPEHIQAYLKQVATRYNPRTLIRHLTSLRQWHLLNRLPDPVMHPQVRKTMRGILRLHGKPKRQAAALRLVDLDKIIDDLNERGTLIAKRNKALILIGYFGALRRSELTALQWNAIRFVNEGMVIQLNRSKTDPAGEGASCAIPFGDHQRCPVRSLIEWRGACQQYSGPIFRRLSTQGTLSCHGISDGQANRIVRAMAEQAGVVQADQMSAHCLRRGFATEASRLGASLPAIQRHGRWRSLKTVVEYIEAGRCFRDSAVRVLFEFG